MDENENRNEIAATLFSVLAGLAVLLLAGWLMTARSCSGTPDVEKVAAAAPAVLPVPSGVSDVEKVELQSDADSFAYESKIKRLEKENKDLQAQLDAKEEARNVSPEPKAVEPDNSALEKLKLEYDGKFEKQKADHLTQIGSKQDEIDKLRLELSNVDKERGELKAQLTGGAALAASAGLAKVQSDLKAKTAMVGDLEGKVSSLELELENAKKAMDKGDNEKISQLMASNKTLESELEKLKALKADNNSLKKQIEELKANSAPQDEIDKLKGEIKTLTAGSADLGKLQKENKKLSDELAKLKGAMDREKASGSKVEALTTENGKLKEKVEELNGEIFTLKNAEKLKPALAVPGLELPLLVNDPTKLDGRLAPLFAELRDVSDYEAGSKDKVYNDIAARGKATPVNNVYFGSGSSWVGDDKKAELKKLLDENPDSKFLVVGYASTDGSPEQNAQLSSKRASEVAQQLVQGSENAKNRVQAVYFGQTARFDNQKLEPNRVVEVWRVNK